MRARGLFAALLEECRGYNGFSEEELAALVATECESVVAERQVAASGLLDAVAEALLAQAQRWRTAAEGIACFRSERVGAAEDHDAAMKALDKRVRKAMKALQADCAEEASCREADLAAAEAAVRRAHSEFDLDGKVAFAREKLAAIEEGYRGANVKLVALAAAHPGSVQELQAAFELSTRDALCLSPPETHGAGATDADPAPENDGETEGPELEPLSVPAAASDTNRSWSFRADLLQAILEAQVAAAASREAKVTETEPCAGSSVEREAGTPQSQATRSAAENIAHTIPERPEVRCALWPGRGPG